MDKSAIGPVGEKLACRTLKRAGVKILAANVRYPVGELDLVGMAGDVLVLVEVKTRQDAGQLNVQEMVGYNKRRRMLAAARKFIREEAPPHSGVRCDVVTVYLPPAGEPVIEHHPDAFDLYSR